MLEYLKYCTQLTEYWLNKSAYLNIVLVLVDDRFDILGILLRDSQIPVMYTFFEVVWIICECKRRLPN